MTEQKVKGILEEIDNYEQSLNACLSFIHIYKWDEKEGKPDNSILYWIGKAYNPGKITPDITMQLSIDKGLVVELKPFLPINEEGHIDKWKKEFKQLKKYDQQLEGWETTNKKVGQQELILITNQKIVKRIIDYIEKNKLYFTYFSKNFCIIQYGLATGKKPAYYLRKEYGRIDDFKHITDKEWGLDGFAVAIEYLIKTGLIRTKFLDYKPPVVYLMSILWDEVFTSLVCEEDWIKAKMESGKKMVKIPANVAELRKILQENFADKNSKQGIKEKWIEEALENFVKLKLATRVKSGNKDYITKFRKKIKGEKEGMSKTQLFAELLYESPLQYTLESDKFKKDVLEYNRK